jgi:hypothetical protein
MIYSEGGQDWELTIDLVTPVAVDRPQRMRSK